ncbi:hypothetical protein GECvBGOT_gp111 [Salmonella phage GEC_vB_GOT]|nr:hypothetical protein GECvBGOT_gp111 [Salmonella phage GEC_vB_GOT]
MICFRRENKIAAFAFTLPTTPVSMSTSSATHSLPFLLIITSRR